MPALAAQVAPAATDDPVVELLDLQRNWDGLGEVDPLWAVLSHPDKRSAWSVDDFFATGRESIGEALTTAERLGYPKRRRTALDFGCGVGRLTQALAASFEHAVGVDIAPSMIRQARELNRHGDRCEYVLNGAADLRVLDGRAFDFVYSSIVLQHIHPRYSVEYVREFVRLLAPGGLALFDLTAEQGNPSPLPPASFRAEIEPQAPVLQLPAGEESPVSARITNRSGVAWTAPLNLGNHWCAVDGSTIAYDDARGSIPVPVAPGQAVEATILVTAPRLPGLYVLELDVVQEGVAWFGVHGSPVVRIPVAVDATGESSAGDAAVAGDQPLVPSMEMYGVPLHVVVQAAHDAGGRALSIETCSSGGPGWIGYRYAFTRA
jgi:SAM-dependent methyltransferase